MTKAEEKQAMRQTLLALEERLPERYLRRSGAEIVRRLLALPEYQEAGTVFCFAGFCREVDTGRILSDALAAGKRLCVPLYTGEGRMELRRITGAGQLRPGAFGVPEPPPESEPVDVDGVDFAVLPCLGCSHDGRRLGRGDGSFDRFLSGYRGGAVVLCRERLIREDIPQEPHDCPVPWVLTERGLWEDGFPARPG